MTNTINKLVFDFTCSSEMMARKTQQEIINYVAPKLGLLMDNYLGNQYNENEIIEIKSLEIDLGNILVDDFADDEILKRVIEEINKKLSNKTKNHEQKPSSLRNSELEIIKSILLMGDVPWWVDKTQIIEFDTLLKHQFEENLEEIKWFFENHQNDLCVRERLVEYFNKSSHDLLKKYFLDDIISEQKKYEYTKVFQQIVEENYSLLKSFFEEYTFLKGQGKDSENGIFNTNIIDLKVNFKELEIQKLIETIINHPYFFKYNLIEIISNIDFENYIENIDYQIFKKENSPVLRWLQSVKNVFAENKKRLDFISKIHQNNLPSNDYFQDEMMLFENIISSKREVSNEQDFLNELKENTELEILLSIFKNKKIETEIERNLLENMMRILPKEILPILYFFIQIKEEEMYPLLPQNLKFKPQIRYNSQESERIKNVFKNAEGDRKTVIENAGICLVSAYLPTFWKNLGYAENKEFKTIQDACNAVCLIQYMATGEKESYEYLWQFNKLLCGFDIDDFISVKHTISDQDFAEADHLLEAIIGNWNALKNTSIEGLRTSFFQRKGILTEKHNHWLLQIERKGFDLLLDSIPWGFSTIKMPWMKKYIQVEW